MNGFRLTFNVNIHFGKYIISVFYIQTKKNCNTERMNVQTKYSNRNVNSDECWPISLFPLKHCFSFFEIADQKNLWNFTKYSLCYAYNTLDTKKNRWLKTTTFSLLKIVMENVWTKRLRIKDQRSKSGIYLFKYYLKISIHTVALHEQNTDKVVLLPGSFLLAIFFWIKNRQVKSFLNYGRPHYYS